MNILKAKNPRSADEVPLIPVHEFLLDKVGTWLEENGDYVWLEDVVGGERYFLSELEPNVRKMASWLSKKGFGLGDVLCVYANNFPHFFTPVLAAWMCGGCVTTSNTMSTTEQLSRQFNNCKAKILICDPKTLPRALEAKCNSRIQHIILIGTKIAPEGIPIISDIFRDDGKACPPPVKPNYKEDMIFLVYSSGTVGLPKGVMHTHFSLMTILTQYKSTQSAGLQFLLTACFFHISGFFACLNWLGRGATLYTLSCYSDEDLLRTIRDKKPSAALLYPHQLTMLSKSPLVDMYDLSSLNVVLTGGAILAADIHRSVKSRLPNLKSLLQVYAMSECMAITTTFPEDNIHGGEIDINKGSEIKVGCVGTVCPFSQVKIVEEVTGKALGPNKTGVLHVKAPCLMKGYFNNPEETARVVDKDGWMCTGDLAYYDSDELVYFVEREKELVKYLSHQIAPAAIEALLLQHPGIEDAAVVGIPNDDAGELPKAFAVRSPSLAGRDLTKDEVLQYINGRVADYEKLRGGLVFVESIPRNPSGKILRRELRER